MLQESDGMLIHDFQNVAIPEDNTTAFMVSLNNRSDSSIRVVQEDGKERVTCGGYSGYPIEQVSARDTGRCGQGDGLGFQVRLVPFLTETRRARK